ncbi:MAG: aminodeoxychorismate synthase component I, partial [Phenylobacterium zucineum]
MYQPERNAFWLDRETHPTQRFSVIGACAEPMEMTGSDAQAQIDEFLEALAVDADIDVPFSWRPGLVGYLDYELSAPKFGFADRAMVFDHDARETYFVGLFEDETDFKHWHNAALLRLSLIGGQLGQYRHRHERFSQVGETRLRHSPAAYLLNIAQAHAAIRRGDVYQICLTNELSAESSIDPLEAFLRLREANPAPYATFIRFGDTAVVSASPEQFLAIDASGQISSKPIKGTRRRGATDAEDQALREELASDPKERAENLMIVDLMRNDFSVVAEPESVAVENLFEVETYASV